MYKNLQRFTRDVIHPFLIGMKHRLVQELLYVHNQIIRLNDQISEAYLTILMELENLRVHLRNKIILTTQFFDIKHATIVTTLTNHSANLNNPHNVTLDQLAHLSSNSPDAADGTTGDVWIKYESATPHYQWVEGLWSECSAPCGGGIQTRVVNCTNENGQIVADVNCTSLGLVKPATSRACNTQACIPSVVASDNILASGYTTTTSNPTNSTASYITAARIVINNLQGTIRLKAAHHDGGKDSFHSNLRLMKNGLQIGYWAADSSSYLQRSIDVSVAPNDILEWQHCGKNTSGVSYFRYDGVFATQIV